MSDECIGCLRASRLKGASLLEGSAAEVEVPEVHRGYATMVHMQAVRASDAGKRRVRWGG